jgi:Uma2 family endonuclease
MITRNPYKVPRTAIEVFEILPEGVHCQVIDNIIYMSPAPTFEHQDIVAVIQNGMFNYITRNNLGKCVQAPIDVFLDNKNAFQPDIIFISKANLIIVKEGKVRGAPDIVVEVLSKGTKDKDLGKKKIAYERNGVKEYFAVEQKTGEVYSFYLKNNKYEAQPKVKGKIISKLLKKSFRF